MDADRQDYQDFKYKAATTKEHEGKDGAGEGGNSPRQGVNGQKAITKKGDREMQP